MIFGRALEVEIGVDFVKLRKAARAVSECHCVFQIVVSPGRLGVGFHGGLFQAGCFRRAVSR